MGCTVVGVKTRRWIEFCGPWKSFKEQYIRSYSQRWYSWLFQSVLSSTGHIRLKGTFPRTNAPLSQACAAGPEQDSNFRLRLVADLSRRWPSRGLRIHKVAHKRTSHDNIQKCTKPRPVCTCSSPTFDTDDVFLPRKFFFAIFLKSSFETQVPEMSADFENHPICLFLLRAA